MPGAKTVIAFRQRQAAWVRHDPSPPSLRGARTAAARDTVELCDLEALQVAPPAQLVLQVEALRSTLADMFRLHGASGSQWTLLRTFEERDLGAMSQAELAGLAVQLHDTLADLLE